MHKSHFAHKPPLGTEQTWIESSGLHKLELALFRCYSQLEIAAPGEGEGEVGELGNMARLSPGNALASSPEPQWAFWSGKSGKTHPLSPSGWSSPFPCPEVVFRKSSRLLLPPKSLMLTLEAPTSPYTLPLSGNWRHKQQQAEASLPLRGTSSVELFCKQTRPASPRAGPEAAW